MNDDLDAGLIVDDEPLSTAMIEPRLENLEAAVGEAGRQIEVVADRLSRAEGKFSQTLTAHLTRLDELERFMPNLSARLGKLQGAVSAEQYAELKTDFDALRVGCEMFGERLDRVAERLGEVESFVRGVAQLPDRVETLDGKVQQGRRAVGIVSERISVMTVSTERLLDRQADLVHGIQRLLEVQCAASRLMWVIGVGAGLVGGALAGVLGMLGGRLL